MSASGTVASPCQTRAACPSITRSMATLTSRSLLDPGKTMTAAFMVGDARLGLLSRQGRAHGGKGAEAGKEGIDDGALLLENLRRRPRHQAVAHVGRHHVPYCGTPLADLQEPYGGVDHVRRIDEAALLHGLMEALDLGARLVGLAADRLGQLVLETRLGVALPQPVHRGVAFGGQRLGRHAQNQYRVGSGGGALLGVEIGGADGIDRARPLLAPAPGRQAHDVAQLAAFEHGRLRRLLGCAWAGGEGQQKREDPRGNACSDAPARLGPAMHRSSPHFTISYAYFSITIFARRSLQMRSTCARARSSSVSASSTSMYLPCLTSLTPSKPRVLSACSMALPCGSRTPCFSVILMLAFTIPSRCQTLESDTSLQCRSCSVGVAVSELQCRSCSVGVAVSVPHGLERHTSS